MKPLNGHARVQAPASRERCFALLADIERYPEWHGEVVRRARWLEPGRRAAVTLHAALGPLVRDFELVMAVSAEPPSLVRLTRVAHEPGDPERFEVTWRLAGSEPTDIELRLDAELDVPRLLPVGGLGESLAGQFAAAAARALASPR